MPKAIETAPFSRWPAFLCFVLSGAASISYEMLWLRQAMTYFGVISPVISSVLSVFMAGLALGTWIAGKLTSRISPGGSIRYYAAIELLVGLYALAVPALFKAGYLQLLTIGAEQSGTYLVWSWAIITAILLPVCTLIGCTFPLLMHYLRGFEENKNNFGFLYYANLLGGALGCVLPLVTIEHYGFASALSVAIGFNVAAGALAMFASFRWQPDVNIPAGREEEAQDARTPISLFLAVTLFLFGFVTMGSEVLWIRMFIVSVGPTVYSFAFILLLYLIFSAVGTDCYLSASKKGTLRSDNAIMMMLPACALLPILAGNINVLKLLSVSTAAVSAISFCLGYLTPQIIDQLSANNARKASVAYLYNFAGCILGPLFSTYIMFFYAGIKGSLVFYAAILLVVSLIFLRRKMAMQWGAAALFLALLYPTWHYENTEEFIARNGRLERDYIGYIGALGQGMDKHLLVNGIGMTYLTTVTKLMAHLPLLHHPQPRSALAICFGMGTTTRSLATWPLAKVTVVELSKGVTHLFSYFHKDAEQVREDPRVRIVVDDGRRYLNRTHELFDVITIDPPPPITSSGSGLLYTDEFLGVLKKRLAPGGILAHWIYPWTFGKNKDKVFMNAAINAIKRNFKYIRIYDSIEPGIGMHVLASDSPIPELTQEEFVRKLPPKAAADLREWQGDSTLEQLAVRSLHEIKENSVLMPELRDVYMSDDRLYNEFYILRTIGIFNPGTPVLAGK